MAIIGTALRRGKGVVARIANLAARRDDQGRPRKTIRIAEHRDRPWWHMGTSGGQPAMRVVGNWNVRNTTDGPVDILAARLVNPKTDGSVLTRRHDGVIFGRYTLPPGATTEISADFWVVPPVRKKGQQFSATVVLTDQFGNDHKVRNVKFRYTNSR